MGLMIAWVMRLNRELDQARRKLEQRHELILESVADGICGVDLEGNTTFANRAMEVILGWSAAELIGHNQHRLLHHTHDDGQAFSIHDCPIYKTFRDRRARFVADDVFWRRDGSSIPVEYSCTPLIDPQGIIVGSVVVFRDISARRRAEEETRQHQRELAHVARLSTMGEMASGIAHELNQPLTAITTNSHACLRLLEAGSVPVGQCADVMERIAAQAEHAGAVLRQIRSFIRKEAPQRECTDLGALVDNVLTLIAAEVRRAGVTLLLDLDESLPEVLAQPIQVEQVILNLVRNAVEAMQEVDEAGRSLTIATRAVGDGMLEMRVSDTGPGIADDLLEQVFQAFVTTKGDGRGDGLGAARSEGMGLGLAISKGIIEAHQGSLSVASRPGHGAEFRFTLPVCRDRNGERS
jgi:two-component system sensor histidine kinase TtrS